MIKTRQLFIEWNKFTVLYQDINCMIDQLPKYQNIFFEKEKNSIKQNQDERTKQNQLKILTHGIIIRMIIIVVLGSSFMTFIKFRNFQRYGDLYIYIYTHS